MTTQTSRPSFGQTSQDRPAVQAARSARSGASRVTASLAERHEALWLSLTALHKDVAALAAKKPASPVSDPVRIAAESLLSDCAPFLRRRCDRLPVAAPDLAGLAVQLGQALAWLEHYELAHSGWDSEQQCFVWQTGNGPLPLRRLRPQVQTLPSRQESREMAELQEQLSRRINAITKGLPDDGDGPPRARSYAPRPPVTYPRAPGIR